MNLPNLKSSTKAFLMLLTFNIVLGIMTYAISDKLIALNFIVGMISIIFGGLFISFRMEAGD